MKPFGDVLTRDEIAAVVDFVWRAFVAGSDPNTRYHTRDNGWPDHERYVAAYPFATGQIPLDTPWENLTAEQQRGWRLYFTACISCHDQSRVNEPGVQWERQALSYPRFGFQPGDWRAPRSLSGATVPVGTQPSVPPGDLTDAERLGAELFQDHCSFCHGFDGTGNNWIGRFMDPGPRNLTDAVSMAALDKGRLIQAIREGLPGTSMPAWRWVLEDQQISAIAAYVLRVLAPASAQTPQQADSE